MPVALIDDKVWWNLERRLTSIGDEIAATTNTGRNVLLLAHFEGTLAALVKALHTKSIEHQRFATPDSSMLCRISSEGIGKVWMGPAKAFLPLTTQAATRVETPLEPPLEIIVAEHHPLRSRDEQLINAAATLGCRVQLTFHISLDDPLLVHFGVTSIQHLFKQLGMGEETCLSNSLVTNAIRRAQERIESGTPKDLPAHSIADWFKYNHAEE